ncbi:U1 zinc finger-domain-containing protein [Lasiosphaeria miniovina]|uniref:U1 small nuclear ribonucleoprotein C n=1 Tax=Lasiosphaeria miniovina TaxID=1954250 RepID=A0AA40E838_9PEZI|nr:U1 zinc finger-domain-containing protein [Lasiosphaeria miniovina]KAK0728572.1 U1 zinc finger-domain-containing protein [Lasiosphaeria miniovina]
MPKFFCDYCDVYLTHDSMSVRKAHNTGRNHLRNVVEYYQQVGHEKAQSVIDSITSSYAAEGQAHNNPMLPQNQPGATLWRLSRNAHASLPRHAAPARSIGTRRRAALFDTAALPRHDPASFCRRPRWHADAALPRRRSWNAAHAPQRHPVPAPARWPAVPPASWSPRRIPLPASNAWCLARRRPWWLPADAAAFRAWSTWRRQRQQMNVVPAIKGNEEWTPNPQKFRNRQKKKNPGSATLCPFMYLLYWPSSCYLAFFLFGRDQKGGHCGGAKRAFPVTLFYFIITTWGWGGMFSLLSSTVVLGSPGVFFHPV